MSDLFSVIAHEDAQDQAKPRQAMALSVQRVEDRFGAFVRQGSVDDQAARFSLVEDDLKAVVASACEQVGYADSESVYKVIANNFVTGDAIPQLRTASVRHEARKPKMCPYHSEVTDISLAAGDAQAGYNAMSSHAWSGKHCQGEEYEGAKCNFKPAMVTQAFWDNKAEQAEQRRNERAEAEQVQESIVPVNGLPEVETPEVADDVSHDEPSAIGDGIEETPQVVEEIPMSMAAKTADYYGLGDHPEQATVAPPCPHCHGLRMPDGSICPVCKGTGYDPRYEAQDARVHGEGMAPEFNEMPGRGRGVDLAGVTPNNALYSRTADTETVNPAMKIDKRKWTPKTVDKDQPLKADDPKGRYPTKRKDVIEPINQTPDTPGNKGELKEIGEATTEHQDVTEKGGIDRDTSQGGSFGGGDRSAVGGLLSREAIQASLSKFKR